MGLFGNKNITIYAPVSGTIKQLSKLTDATFAQKILGDGLAITPNSGEVKSPLAKGSVINAFHTGHAYGLSTGKGPEVLVHFGMDTVMLDGKGFDVKVATGDKVKLDTTLCEVDLKSVKKEAPSVDTPIIITNDSIGTYKINFLKKSGKVEAGEPIFELVK